MLIRKYYHYVPVHKRKYVIDTKQLLTETYQRMHVTSTYFSSGISVCNLMVQDECRVCAQPSNQLSTLRSWSRVSENVGSQKYDEIVISWEPLGAFPKLRKATVAFVLCSCPSASLSVCLSIIQAVRQSVCLSMCNNSPRSGRIFMKLNIWRFFENSSLIKPEKNTWRPMYIYDNITLVVGGITVVVETIKTHYWLHKLFPKILPLWDKTKK